ncbi:helix-turn-helix domain-containing protein [Sphingobacterium oryzagri]|uniref:Helix-turn-helix domain-containing protein n=1 Tax=Sphingobacterium oryzagri TaxID=3025669 RepID=A0ABY7WLS9_9SPHI|nr:helix-turn-helix domain-containing protein [Sphingobacterium sp. KACC 22765]WDF70534.1 helix-turn-helix domain-containing protein [Sphingobacterium sp. KACC 22765]
MEDNAFKRDCRKNIRAVHDAMDVLSGKWKVSIIAVLCYSSQQRFSEILSNVEGISNKMLSKELKELESDKLVKRTVLSTQPVTVSYELTPYGKSLKDVIMHLARWGTEHRQEIIAG